MNLLRWAQFGIVGAGVTLGLVIASADGSGAGSGGAGGGQRPFQAAFDACAKSKQGDACTFHTRNDKLIHGTCVPSMRDKTKLVCRAKGGGGGGGDGGGGGGGDGGTGGAGSGKGSGAGKGSATK